MIIPIGIDQPIRRKRIVTHALVALNVAAFLVFLSAGMGQEDYLEMLVKRYGISAAHHEWWRFLTYTIVHGGGLHLFGNMLLLWIFGPFLEDRLGHVGFLALYIAGAVGAGWAHILTDAHPAVGASGAVSAVTGAFLVLAPLVHVRIFIFFFLIGVFEIPAAWFIGFAILKDFVGISMQGSDGVAHGAHLGGVAIGMVVAFVLIATGLIKRQSFDLLAIAKHSKRRSEFRAAFDERKKIPAATEAPAAVQKDIAERAEVMRLLGEDKAAEAATAYAKLIEGDRIVTLPARQQLEVANQLFYTERRAAAFRAYELFIMVYPRDREIANVKLLAALTAARYLSKPQRARELIADAMPGLHGEERTLAEEILREISGQGDGAVLA